MRRWKTVVPMIHLRVPEDEPFQFAPETWFDRIPDWLKADILIKRLSARDQEIFSQCTHCLIYEYEAEALGSEDPQWTGQKPRSIQKSKSELSYLANLALWLQKPSPTRFNVVFHNPEFSGTFCIQQTEHPSGFLCHPEDFRNRITALDLKPASELYSMLTAIPRNTAPWTALRALTAALETNAEEIRYLLLWVALEALFGADAEITYRISQRLALFLAKSQNEARELFEQAKRGYGLRCRVAHGSWEQNDKTTALTAITETLARRSFIQMLESQDTLKPFLDKQREPFLNDLAFKWLPAPI
jgi:hypothetical protein